MHSTRFRLLLITSLFLIVGSLIGQESSTTPPADTTKSAKKQKPKKPKSASKIKAYKDVITNEAVTDKR